MSAIVENPEHEEQSESLPVYDKKEEEEDEDEMGDIGEMGRRGGGEVKWTSNELYGNKPSSISNSSSSHRASDKG